jgi:pimeloyl-ACP methyl ester carboxylesterase
LKILLIGAAVIAVILLGPFLIPVPDLKDTVDPSLLAEEDSLFVRLENVNVHYKVSGEGFPPVVLLHGFGASTFSWREVFSPLADRFTVMAFDRPGFGLTSRPLGEEIKGFNPYTQENQVELTVKLMDHLGFEKAVLIGNSAGGLTALEIAIAHPERVIGLVMVDAAVYTNDGDNLFFKLLTSTPQGRHLGPLVSRLFLNDARSLLDLAWHDPSKITPEILEGYEKPLKANDWDRALWELTLARRKFDVSKLGNIDIPTLVLSGDDDRIVPVEDSVRLAREIPNAVLHIFPDTGHVPQEENPQEFLEVVLPFIESLSLIERSEDRNPD